MTILSTPFIAHTHCRWNTVTSGLRHFCVQENTEREANKGKNIQQCVHSEKGLKPFRIIYINKPLDLSNSNTEIEQVSRKHNKITGVPANDIIGNSIDFNPAVVAVADNMEDILDDWASILKAGLAVKRGTNTVPFDSKDSGDHQAWWLEIFIEKVWQPLYTDLLEQLSRKKAEAADGDVGKKSPSPGKRGESSLPPLAQSSLLPKMDMSATGAVSTATRRNIHQEGTFSTPLLNATTSESSPRGSTALNRSDEACSTFYDMYDVVILRLWDLWGWRDPQHTALFLLVLILVGAFYRGTYFCNSAVTALLLFILSIPLTLEQQSRVRKVPRLTQTESSCASLKPADILVPEDEKGMKKAQNWIEDCIVCDANRMQFLNKLFPLPSSSLGQGALKANPNSLPPSFGVARDVKLPLLKKVVQRIGFPLQNAAAIEKLLQSFFGRIWIVYVLVQLVIAMFLPYYSIGLIVDTLVAPLVVVSMLITGLGRLRPALIETLKGVYSRAQNERWVPRLMEVVNPIVSRGSGSVKAFCASNSSDLGSAPLQTIAKSPLVKTSLEKECPQEEKASNPPSQPHSHTASGPLSEINLRGRDQTHVYCLPALTDKEIAIVEQLTNYGAPFSMVLLKPIREWNQKSGWFVKWERGGLLCEERHLGGGSSEGCDKQIVALRFTARIPNANVGTLQTVLLDDPDFLDTKDTFAYEYTPMLMQNCVVKRLGYNLLILLSRYRSPIHEVPPLEMLRYLSPSISLDPEQQEALRLRRPYTQSTLSSVSSVDGSYNNSIARAGVGASKGEKPLMAFVQCAIPCPQELHPTPPCQPPHCRGPTEMFSILGLEEADGSLTLGLCTSLNGAEIIPGEWASVYKSLIERKAYQLMELLKRFGPMPNQLAVYRNERYFQPLLKRQALSQVEMPSTSLTEKQSASMQNSMIGSAFLTSDLKLFNAPQGTLIHRTLSGKTIPSFSPNVSRTLSLPGSVPRTVLASMSEASAQEPVPWPHLVELFVKKLLAPTSWKQENKSGSVVLYTGTTSFTEAKAYCTVTFAAGAKLSVAESVIYLNQFVHDLNVYANRQITITPKTLEELLADAVPPPSAEDERKRGTKESAGGGKPGNDDGVGGAESTRSGGSTIPKRGALPRPDFAREAYYGFTLRFTRFHHAKWGMPVVDTVSRVGEPYYCLAKDALATLFGAGELAGRPLAGLRSLPPETKMLFCCGEDASAVLPEMKGSKRCRVFLFGHLCWEGVSSDHGERGIHMINCWVSDFSMLVPAISASDMMQSHLRMIELQKLQIIRMSKEGVQS